MKNLTYSLYKLNNTVFTAKDIALILGETDRNLLKAKINYYVKRGELIALRRGIYAKNINYNRFELGTKILIPAYISLETVLQREGVTFQDYESIFVISYQSREIKIGDKNYIFKKIKKNILTNTLGLRQEGEYYIATKERAFLDAVYLYKNYYFDNLDLLDWNLIKKLLPIYNNQALNKRVKSYV